MIRFPVLFLCFFYGFSYAALSPNNQTKQKIIKLKLPQKDVSIVIQGVHNRKPLVSINSNKLLNPASVNKILTTYSSLLHLGSNYRWKTKFYITGKLKNGILNGNLVVKGFGNPDLRTEDLKDIVNGIFNAGIKKIKGNLIIDDSYFRIKRRNWTNFDKNTFSSYNAAPNAFMFNHHSVALEIVPNSKKNQISIFRDFPDYSYSIINKIQAVRKKCRGKYSYPLIKITKNKKGRAIVNFYGKQSVYCKPSKIYRVLTSSHMTFYAALSKKIKQKGGFLKGKLIIGKKPAQSRLVYTHKSLPLLEIISKVNKKSNNVMAKQILLTLGCHFYNKNSSFSEGAKAVKSILMKEKLIDKNTKIVNGSGLSRKAKINAKSLVKLLKHGYRSDYKWMDTLSILGKDGTLKKRLKWTNIKNNAWLKTGSLKNVRSIAGYVKAKSGKIYVLVMMVNNSRARYKGLKLQDDLIKWIWRYG